MGQDDAVLTSVMNETSFESYIPNTVDPSPWVLVGTMGLCFLSILLFPLCIAIHQKLVQAKREKDSNGSAIPQRKRARNSTDEQTAIETTHMRMNRLRPLRRSTMVTHVVGTVLTSPLSFACPSNWPGNNNDDDDGKSSVYHSMRPNNGRGTNEFVSVSVENRYQPFKERSKRQTNGDDVESVGSSSVVSGIKMALFSHRGDKQSPSPSTRSIFAQKYEIDMVHGPRPWCCYYGSRGFFRKVRKCAAFDKEMGKLFALAIPFTLDTGVAEIMELLEVIVVSQLLGTASLSAYYSVEFVLSLSTMFFHGAMSSLTLLCSQAIGARNLTLAGQYVQLAILQRQIFCIPFFVFWWYNLGDVVAWLGFSADTAEIAQQYCKYAFLSELLEAVSDGFTYMLEVSGFEAYSATMNTTHAVTSFLAVLAASLFYPQAGLWTIGIIHVASTGLFLFVNIGSILRNGWIRDFWKGILFKCALCNLPAVSSFVKASIPMAFGYATEYCEWELLVIFAAVAGPAEVAVWGLIGSVWEVAENIGLSIADAAEVRVGQLLGSNRPQLARYCAHKALFLGFVSSILMALLLFALSPFLPFWLTKDSALRAMLKDLLPLVCVGLVALTFGTMSWTILCAQGRVLLATSTAFLGTLLVTIPLACLSTFGLGWNLQGLLGSVVIGYLFSGMVNSFHMVLTDWEGRAKRVCRQNRTQKATAADNSVEAEGDTDDESIDVGYDDFDWDELPDKVREAANSLGYTERMWNNDKEPKGLDVYWHQLTVDQRRAAETLGYTKAVWNQSDD